MRKLAEHGIDRTGKTARQLIHSDYGKHDLLVGTNRADIPTIRRTCGGDVGVKKHLLMDCTIHPGDTADPWYAEQLIRLPGGCICTPIPAAHETYELDENGDYRILSYIFQTSDGMKLFHAGDAVVTPELVERLQREHSLDVALLPINGADYKRRLRGVIGNMNSRKAADLAHDIDADLVIPCHYDMVFQNGEDPLHFAEYMQTYYPGRKFHILSLGERFLLTPAHIGEAPQTAGCVQQTGSWKER